MMAETKDDNDELAMLEKDIKEFWTKFKTICCHEPIDQVLGLRDSWYESINNLSGKIISGLLFWIFQKMKYPVYSSFPF